MDFFLNTLSADRQATGDLDSYLERFLNCLRPIREALRAGNATLKVDEAIYERSLYAASESLHQCLALVKNRALVSEWYTYTKSLSKLQDWNLTHTQIIAEGGLVEGAAATSLIEGPILFGFGGRKLLEAANVRVKQPDLGSDQMVQSFCDPASLWRFAPRYERNDKHGRDGYFREGGVWVAPMTVTDYRAQELLLIAVGDGDERYAKEGDLYLKFVSSGEFGPGPVFHAYEVGRDEVPPSVLDKIE